MSPEHASALATVAFCADIELVATALSDEYGMLSLTELMEFVDSMREFAGKVQAEDDV